MGSYKDLFFLGLALAVICGVSCLTPDGLSTQDGHPATRDLSSYCPLAADINEDDYDCFPTTREEFDGTTYLSEESFCELIDDPSLIYHCKAGHWTISDAGPAKHRSKRWFFVAIFAAVACIFFCGGRRGSSPPPNNPPQFTYCPSDIDVTASSGYTRATATWSSPTATDPGDSTPQLRQERGPSSGNTFDEGNTFISYKAWDSRGLSAYCYFTVRVRVLTCSSPTYLLRGRQTCSGERNNIDGTVCKHSCDLGYELSGSPTVQCQRTWFMGISWSTAFPTCQPISCSSPGSVAGGRIECPSGHRYSELCSVICSPGYRHTGSTYISCTAARTWTRADPCKDAEPPKFPNGCPARQDVYTGPMEAPVALTWSDPVTADNSGEVATLTSDIAKGSLAGPGLKVVTLTAKDTAGNTASCWFLIAVKAKECPTLFAPDHGKVTCSRRHVEGSKCNVTCAIGYRPQGNATLSCLASETWDASLPQCQAVVCAGTPNVDHGGFECPRGRQFPESCILVCDSGFVVRPPYSIQCLANATWTQPGECKDIEPPVFPNGCPANIATYAARLGESTRISWNPPLVSDNSAQTIQLTSDVPSNSSFQPGESRVTYTAADVTGNKRTCEFKVTINTLRCSAPDFEPANRTKTLMTYTCPSGLVHGATCTLACLQGYPLVGPDNITCERDDTTYPPTMYWKWPGLSANKPKCEDNVCPKLAAPQNGALACHLGNFGWDCLMSCLDGWDVPAASTSEHYYCTNSNGNWIPSTVPGCVYKLRPIDRRLMADVFYFAGSCNASLDELRSNFITRMNSSIWRDACVGTCFVDNVQVTCGPVSGRRRRNVVFAYYARNSRLRRQARQVVFITFEISLGVASAATYQEVDKMKDNISRALFTDANNGHFNIGDLHADQYSFSLPKIGAQCPPGSLYMERNSNPSLSCSGCGAGHYLPVGSTQCQPCPVGSYTNLDNATTCTLCPPTWSTASTGSKNSTECRELCIAGTFSYNGFSPCQPCPAGSYQSRDRATFCDLCPVGTWTISARATAFALCRPADVSLNNASLTVSAKEGQNSSGLSISVWVKPLQAANINVSFTSTSKLLSPPPGKWSQVLATADPRLGIVTLYFQNSSVANIYHSAGQTVLNMSSISFRLQVSQGTVLVSGFRAWDKVLSEWERAAASLTCIGNATSSILTWSPSPSTVQLPSVCDAVDECLQSPCGAHPCENTPDGFVCRCLAGWTGLTCNIPPDPCSNHQCRHGATCVSGKNNYTCICPAVYSGDMCDLIQVPGGWGEWTTGADCSASCGNGVRSRQRLCNNPAPRYGGANCTGVDRETQTCNVVPCVTATWGNWSAWDDCSATCGAGVRTRKRSCTKWGAQNVTGCEGPEADEEACSISLCPVHGGWSSWSEWSQCSVTCGQGYKSRDRTCTNPLPEQGGNACAGSSTDNSTCNNGICPECPLLKRPIRTILVCNDSTSPYLRVCNLTCAPGYASPSEPFPLYMCGAKTNFLWSHQVDNESDTSLPECDTPGFPSKGTMSQSVLMDADCNQSAAREVQIRIQNNMQAALPCSINSDCTTKISVGCIVSSSNRRKRSTQTLEVHFNMTLDFTAFQNASGNDTEAVQKFVELLQLGEKSAAMVAMNDTENLFTVSIGGREIKPDLDSVSYTAGLNCPSGSVLQRGFCLACPTGTKEVSGECVPCPIGQYQDQPASTVCKDCPGGTTWHLLGAVSITQCIVPLNRSHDTARGDNDSALSQTTILIAGIVCGTVLLCAVVAAVGIYKYTQLHRLRMENECGHGDACPPPYSDPPIDLHGGPSSSKA